MCGCACARASCMMHFFSVFSQQANTLDHFGPWTRARASNSAAAQTHVVESGRNPALAPGTPLTLHTNSSVAASRRRGCESNNSCAVNDNDDDNDDDDKVGR